MSAERISKERAQELRERMAQQRQMVAALPTEVFRRKCTTKVNARGIVIQISDMEYTGKPKKGKKVGEKKMGKRIGVQIIGLVAPQDKADGEFLDEDHLMIRIPLRAKEEEDDKKKKGSDSEGEDKKKKSKKGKKESEEEDGKKKSKKGKKKASESGSGSGSSSGSASEAEDKPKGKKAKEDDVEMEDATDVLSVGDIKSFALFKTESLPPLNSLVTIYDVHPTPPSKKKKDDKKGEEVKAISGNFWNCESSVDVEPLPAGQNLSTFLDSLSSKVKDRIFALRPAQMEYQRYYLKLRGRDKNEDEELLRLSDMCDADNKDANGNPIPFNGVIANEADYKDFTIKINDEPTKPAVSINVLAHVSGTCSDDPTKYINYSTARSAIINMTIYDSALAPLMGIGPLPSGKKNRKLLPPAMVNLWKDVAQFWMPYADMMLHGYANQASDPHKDTSTGYRDPFILKLSVGLVMPRNLAEVARAVGFLISSDAARELYNSDLNRELNELNCTITVNNMTADQVVNLHAINDPRKVYDSPDFEIYAVLPIQFGKTYAQIDKNLKDKAKFSIEENDAFVLRDEKPEGTKINSPQNESKFIFVVRAPLGAGAAAGAVDTMSKKRSRDTVEREDTATAAAADGEEGAGAGAAADATDGGKKHKKHRKNE